MSDLKASPQSDMHVCTVKNQSQYLPSLHRTLPDLCGSPHLCIMWNCPGKGICACGPQDRACPPRVRGLATFPGPMGLSPEDLSPHGLQAPSTVPGRQNHLP